MPRKTTCPECPTHFCCFNIKTHTNQTDLLRFERVGNHLTRHNSIDQINKAKEPGIHYFISGDDVWISIRGFCAAFDLQTGYCMAHVPSLLPKACEFTQEGGELCPTT